MLIRWLIMLYRLFVYLKLNLLEYLIGLSNKGWSLALNANNLLLGVFSYLKFNNSIIILVYSRLTYFTLQVLLNYKKQKGTLGYVSAFFEVFVAFYHFFRSLSKFLSLFSKFLIPFSTYSCLPFFYLFLFPSFYSFFFKVFVAFFSISISMFFQYHGCCLGKSIAGQWVLGLKTQFKWGVHY